jgi:hypothetical protein
MLQKTVGIVDGICIIEIATCIVLRNASGPAYSTLGGDISAFCGGDGDQGSVEPPMSVGSPTTLVTVFQEPCFGR